MAKVTAVRIGAVVMVFAGQRGVLSVERAENNDNVKYRVQPAGPARKHSY